MTQKLSSKSCERAKLYHSSFFVHSFSRKRRLFLFGSVRNLMVCVGGHVLFEVSLVCDPDLKCLAVFHNHGFVPSFCFSLFDFFEEWWCPPSSLTSLSVYSLLLHSSFLCLIVHSEIQSFKRMVRCASLCVCLRGVRACVCAMLLLLLFIRRFAFGCVVHSVLHLMSVCFRVDWLLLHCSVSVFSFSSSFFFCMICIRLGGLPNLFFLVLFFLFWLVSCCIRCLLIGTPLVMWCALDWLCIIWVWPLSILLHCV